MHWQDACRESEDKVCYRKDRDGRLVIRYLDGSGMKLQGGSYVDVPRSKLEGYMDWKPKFPSPPIPKKKSRIKSILKSIRDWCNRWTQCPVSYREYVHGPELHCVRRKGHWGKHEDWLGKWRK